jgi:hypothetical protein
VGGEYHFLSQGERKYVHLEHFWVLLRLRRRRNAQKLLKQAYYSHFQLNFGTFSTFSQFSQFFADFGCFFYLIKEFLKGYGGTTFLAPTFILNYDPL